MTLLAISFFAGVLTVLAPCILPLLPIVIGRSVGGQHKYRPLIVSGSLAVAVVVFTLLLKASTAFINIPQGVWSAVSGGIIIVFGLVSLFPTLWEKISTRFKLLQGSNQLLGKSKSYAGVKGDVLLGLSLGPVFSSCSPTYFLILATVLPQSYATGIVYLVAYALGLSLVLLLVGYLGQRIVKRLNILSDAHGWFKRGLGILFIIVGIFIFTGTDKKLQASLIEKGFFDTTINFEQTLLTEKMKDEIPNMPQIPQDKSKQYPRYREIVKPSGFVNSDGVTLGELVGKKVILLDFMTYSCINCQRTFPYLNAWYEKYKDQGLEIVGIHTPEFAFEHKKENVEEAAQEFGLKFPLVLDNDYATWGAYSNRYWPRKYLIDIDGYIVYDHIGEGKYDVTERKVQELLKEREVRLSEGMKISSDITEPSDVEVPVGVGSPETYFGLARNNNLGVAVSEKDGVVTFVEPDQVRANRIYLVGDWKVTDEYVQAVSPDAKIVYKYRAQKVFLVAAAQDKVNATILVDGKPVGQRAGEDVDGGQLQVQNEQLYRIIEDPVGSAEHTLEILILSPGLQAYAFTFG